MATVLLDTVLLAPADELGNLLELDVSSLDEDDGLMGEVRTYANGRRRAVTRAGRARTIGLTFDVVGDRDLVEMIRSWQGRTLLYRDPRGRKVWCVFFNQPVKERIPVDVVEVQLLLTEVSYDEAV